jgi:hypothetical protein
MGAQQSDVPMFQTELAPEGGFLSWLLQQIAAPMPILICLLLIYPFGDLVARWIRQSDSNIIDLAFFAVPSWFLSFFLAIAVYRLFAGAAIMGRWIWALPLLLLLAMFCWGLTSQSLGRTLADFFLPESEDGWLFFIATCPTGSAIAYSLGMIWSTRRQASKAPATRNSRPDDASGVTHSSSL